MLLCPFQNTAVKYVDWVQQRPRVSQEYGENPQMYEPLGLKSHNGTDIAVPIGTPVFADMDGIVKVKDSKDQGYGLHIKLRSSFKALETVHGHLSKVFVKDGERVYMGQKIALSGNSGFSTGPHHHGGMRRIIPQTGDIFKWKVKDYDNGNYGWVDDMPFRITWKGSLSTNTLT